MRIKKIEGRTKFMYELEEADVINALCNYIYDQTGNKVADGITCLRVNDYTQLYPYVLEVTV